MTSPKQLSSNRQNALRSSGPRTAKGRARSARNALAHGLYTAAVVPAAGEPPEMFAELCAAVRRELRPRGVIEERLADRVALTLLRFDRVMRYEAAVASAALTGAGALNLPRDPESVTGEGVNLALPAPAVNAPVVPRLAHVRARLAGLVPARAARAAAVAALDGRTSEDPLALPGAHSVRRELEALLGWSWEESWTRWTAAREAQPGGEAFPALVRRLAEASGLDPASVTEAFRAKLTELVATYDPLIAELEAGERALAAELRADRERAAAVAVYADGAAVTRVMRVEGHLTRQLALVLDQLTRLRGSETGGTVGTGVLLRALPSTSLRALAGPTEVGSFGGGGEDEDAPVSVPLRERGYGRDRELG